MKVLTILILASAFAASTNMFAADLNKTEIQNLKEQPQLIMIISSNRVVATVAIKKSGTLALEAENISSSKAKKFGLVYSLKGKTKLEMLVDGKPELTISADAMSIQEKGYATKDAK